MNKTPAPPRISVAYVSYSVAILFLLAFARFFLLPPEGIGNLPVALLGIAPHLGSPEAWTWSSRRPW